MLGCALGHRPTDSSRDREQSLNWARRRAMAPVLRRLSVIAFNLSAAQVLAPTQAERPSPNFCGA